MVKDATEQGLRDSKEAQKGLNIIFILLVVAANSILVIQIFRKHSTKILLNTRCCIFLLLALGDVFSVMFHLSVESIILFEDSDKVSCRTWKFAPVSMVYMDFVYPISVVLIVLEMFLKIKIDQSRKVFSIMFPMIPFGLGLVVIFPLEYVDFSHSICSYELTKEDILVRLRAMVIVYFCVGPVLAVAAACLSTCISPDNTQQQSGTIILLEQQTVGDRNLNANFPYHNFSQAPEHSQVTQSNQVLQTNQVPQNCQVAHPFDVSQTQTHVSTSKEKQSLLIVSVLCFIFYLPYGIFRLAYSLNTDRALLDWDVETSISLFLYYFTFLRPVLTPLFSLKLL